MEPQFSYAAARGPPPSGGHGETDADEMQHMWQFLDSSLTTPPTVAHATSTQPPPELRDDPREPALADDDGGIYNELGDVFNNLLFFNGDADDRSPQQLLHGAAAPGMATNMNHLPSGKFSEHGAGSVSGTAPPSTAAVAAPVAGGDGVGVGVGGGSQKVQLPRSASVSSSHSGVDSISPVGLLGYPSMSPATINWLQSLATSASSDSLTGLISPATLYGGSASITPSAVSGSAGGLASSAGPVDASAAKNGALPRSPSCEMIDWKAYNEAVGIAENAQREPAKWRVIPQHGPHADPGAVMNSANPPGENGRILGSEQAAKAELALADPIQASQFIGQHGMAVDPAAMSDVSSEPGLRNHLTRQFETIKSTVVSIVGALSAPASPSSEAVGGKELDYSQQVSMGGLAGQPLMAQPTALSAQEQLQSTAKRIADEKNKRKAIISPEYVQYGNTGASAGNPLFGDPNVVKIEGDLNHMQFATDVPDPTGRRPSKRTLHRTVAGSVAMVGAAQIGADTDDSVLGAHDSTQSIDGDAVSPGLIRCKCTGKCRNARCACVKAGFVCGVHCKCVSCANPFVPMEKEGIDIQKMVQDVCLMQYLSKVKDMQELLDSTVAYECCDGVVQVKHTIENGFTCPHCQAHYTYSWCNNRLCHDQKKPRKHCAKCRRCGDHRNEHCDDCNHCYFAGVANSFSCSCKSGKAVTGSGVKARSVVPSASSVDGGGSGSKASASPPDLFGTRDENSNASNVAGSGAAHTSAGTVASGLSGPDNEADDACKMQ